MSTYETSFNRPNHTPWWWPQVESSVHKEFITRTVYLAVTNLEDNLGRVICMRMQLSLDPIVWFDCA